MGRGKYRNSLCVCGSGKKWKRCCWDKKPNEISYNHVHVQNNPEALCITCRELAQKLAVKSAMPVSVEPKSEELITAEL